MNKIDKLVIAQQYLPDLKNYSLKLLVHLIMHDEIEGRRYTQQILKDETGLASNSIQKGIKELEDKGLLKREYVGKGSRIKNCPKFKLTL